MTNINFANSIYSENILSIVTDPYFPDFTIALSSMAVGEMVGKSKLLYGGGIGFVTPLCLYGVERFLKNRNKRDNKPLISSIISSVSASAGILLNSYLKPAPDVIRLVIASVVVLTLSINLSRLAQLCSFQPTLLEEHKNSPKYDFSLEEMPMRV